MTESKTRDRAADKAEFERRTGLDHDELEARIRQMKWKDVVKLLKEAVVKEPPREMPQAVLDWFDLNRKTIDEAVLEKAKGVVTRLEQYAATTKIDLGEAAERAPIGVWWIGISHYLRDGKRWWLLRAFRDDGADAQAGSTKDDLYRLRKIVDYAGGNAKKLLIDAGDTLIWTWRV